MSLTRIGSIGINTGIAFAGVTTIVTLNTANDALSIGATVNVGSGITLGASGDVFFTGIATGNGSGLTALNASNIASGTVPTARLGSGTASSSTFLRGDSTFQTVSTDLVDDTTPQLGGNLDVNTKNILFGDSSDGSSDDALIFGAGSDLAIYHDGSNSFIKNSTGNLRIQDTNGNIQIQAKAGEESIIAKTDGAVELYYDNSKKLETSSTGVTITGGINASGASEFTDDLKLDGATAGRDITFDRSDNQLEFEDNAKAAFGTGGADMQIYSDGTNHIIYAGTNTLRVVADNIHLEAGDFGDEFLRCNHDGSVALYYDNDNTFSTSTSGVDVKVTSTDTSTPPDKYLLVYNANDGANTMAGIRFVATSNSSSDHYIFQKKHGSGTGADLVISQNTSERARFTEHGGINFNGDTASANALDDYEEGTWTPAFSSGETLTNNQSTYTRIGRLVVTNCYISNFSNFDGNNNEFRITGLPFPAHNAQGGSYHGGGMITYATSMNYSYPLLPLVGGNSDYIYFHRQDGTASSWKFQDFHNTGLSSGGALIVQMIYETDY